MKKYFAIVFIIVLAAAMMLASCSGGSFGCESTDSKNVTFEAEKVTTEMTTVSGGLEAAEGESVILDASELTEGSVTFDFFSNEGFEDPAVLPDDENLEPVMSITVDAGQNDSSTINPGGYLVRATVEKADGKVYLTIAPADRAGSDWTEAPSTDVAGEMAGVGLFLCDPQGTSLGKVTNSDYHYKAGVAEAHYGLAAVSLYVHKGLKKDYGDDVSFDDNNYAHEWTWNIDGTEIKCFGNREGEATKSIWTTEDYAYSVTAYGEGGDTDYGLSEEDFTTIFKDLQ